MISEKANGKNARFFARFFFSPMIIGCRGAGGFFDYMMRTESRFRMTESPFSRIFLKILFYFGRLLDQRGEEMDGRDYFCGMGIQTMGETIWKVQ
jgi:hypothetical protein